MTNDDYDNLRRKLQEWFDERYVTKEEAKLDSMLVRGFAGLVLTTFIVGLIALVIK